MAAVAQQYEDAYGSIALKALAEKSYKLPQFVPSEIHAALAELPFSLILTTCQDDLMAHALQAAGKAPIVQRYHINGDKRDNPSSCYRTRRTHRSCTTCSATHTSPIRLF